MTDIRMRWPRWAPAHTLLLLADGLWAPATGQHLPDFAAWCAAHPGQRCTLWVGDSHVTDLVCEAGAPLAAPAARSAWARRVLEHYRGQAASPWSLLPWRQGAAWGACALSGLALDPLRQQAQAQDVKLLAVRPLWPLLLQRLLAAQPELRRAARAQAWLMETTAGAQLTCLSLSRGRLTAIQRRRLRAPWHSHLQALVDEDQTLPGQAALLLCLGPALDASAGLKLPLGVAETLTPPYRGLVPRAAERGPDFLSPLPRPGLLAWAWLATTALVLGLAGWEARMAWRAQQDVLSLALPTAPRLATTVKRLAAPEPAQQLRLAHPWQLVFKASESPAAVGLNWLTLDHRVGGELRLQGVTLDSAAVQRAAAGLRAQPAWRQVLVSRLENQASGSSFEIVARMAQAGP